MGKIILRWVVFILVVAIVLGVIAFLSNSDSGGVFWLVVLLLSIVGSGSWATTSTIKIYHQTKDAGNRWLEENHWDKRTSLQYRRWQVYVNNATQEVAVFSTANSTKQPERVFHFRDIKGADLYQEDVKGKRSVRVVIQLMDGQPYAVAVTDRPLPPDSPELQQALAFAKRVNELFAMLANGNLASAAGKPYVIAKCYNCGQLLRGEAGRSGWCPKCDARIQMPAATTPGVRIDRSHRCL